MFLLVKFYSFVAANDFAVSDFVSNFKNKKTES